MELTSLLGNVFDSNEGLVVHLHAVFGRADNSCLTGHLVEAKVFGACEVFVKVLDKKLNKSYDEVTGLKLLKGGGEYD